jgi:cell wall-associated NlpC family hydrolase
MIAMVLAMVLFFGAIPMNAFAAGDVKYGLAYVNAKELRLRSEASTSSKILDTASTAEVVVVVSKHGDWYKVIYNLQVGYMHEDYLIVKTAANAELGYGKINANSVNIRSGAGTSNASVAKGSRGDKAYIIGIKDGWYKIIFGDKIGYIRSDYMDLTEVPYENRDSKNDPLFFVKGESTGIEPSASALNGTPEAPKEEPKDENVQKPAEEPKEESTSSSSSGVKLGIAFVTGSGLRLRSKASTSSDIIDSASKNEVVVVISKNGDWYKVNYDLQVGYMHADYLNVQKTGNAELGYGKFTADSVNVRSGASTSNSAITKGYRGEKAYIIGIKDGWYRIIFNDKIGYVRSDYLELTETPYENKSSSKSPKFYRGGKSTGTEPSAEALKGGSGSSNSGSEVTGSVTGAQIVAKAKQYLGVPYKWGGTDPSGFDCSGFVYYVLRSLGINVSRTQSTMYSQGTPVSKSNLKPGDIVFFQNTYKEGLSHVGIYVGDGQFIHSPSSGKVVSYADLYSDYYIEHYYGACRFTK